MSKKALATIGSIAFCLWTLWAAGLGILRLLGSDLKIESIGQWGDSFGGLNALFSAAAFIAVLFTLRIQSKEIQAQQEEIQRQNERIARSERDADLKQFEATFFELFGLFREMREKVKYHAPSGSAPTGVEAFEAALNDLDRELAPLKRYMGGRDEVEENIRETYKRLHRVSERSLGPYFRILYTILRRVSEKSILKTEQKAQYGNLIRSQLSSPEVALIAANALTEASNDFRNYVIEFRLLKYLPDDYLKSRFREIYPPETFSPRD